MGIVEITSALLAILTLACVAGAIGYALEASFLDILALESALHSARLESAQAAQESAPYIPHTYCAVVDVAWLLESAEAQARLSGSAGAGVAGAAGEAMERACEAVTTVARAYPSAPLAPVASAPRTLTLAPSAAMFAPSMPVAPSAARLESIAPIATLSPTVAPSAPLSFGATLPRPARLPLTLLAASTPRLESAPKSTDAAGESGIRALRPERAEPSERTDAWGRPERARLTAGELLALRGASLRPELERAS